MFLCSASVTVIVLTLALPKIAIKGLDLAVYVTSLKMFDGVWSLHTSDKMMNDYIALLYN